VVSCYLLERRVLPGKGTGILEGDLAWGAWVRDALPLERIWLHSTVVIQGTISATLTAVRWIK
jgi:hypothetical protein